jgi:CRISPR-associated protein Cas2
VLNDGQLEILLDRLERVIDPADDSLRIYRLREPRDRFVRVLGRELEHDLHDPLVL